MSATVLTAVTVTVGKWANNEKLTIKIVVGSTIMAVGLAFMNEASPDLASKFAVLIVIVALFRWFPAIAAKAGLIKSAPKWGG